jgi:predicted metal-dependent hydrolase
VSSKRPIGKPERPRDELGRPLPWGSESRIALEDYEALPIEENHRLGRDHFNAGRFFQAHEAWEEAWRKARGSADEEFFKGLSQVAAGYTHHLRGNPRGARTLIARGLDRVRGYGRLHQGIDLAALAATLERDLEALAAGEAPAFGRPAL